MPRLLGRVVEQRRRSRLAAAPRAGERIATLEQRVENLESLVEGLQDSVHRLSTRLEARLRELDRKSEPLEIRRALDQDARERGV